MWVCLRQGQNIVHKGKLTRYQAGDWVDVGRQIAEGWVAAGIAYTVEPEDIGKVQATSGIAVRGRLSEGWRERLAKIERLRLAFYEDGWTPDLPFTETLIWTPDFDLRLDFMTVGFNLLKKWQVVVPLWDYTTLAVQVGTPEDRAAAHAVLRDLRVPLRDTRLIFVRRCSDTRDLMRVWGELLKTCSDERLAFLQALYMVKPVVCDVPCSWTGKSA